MTLRLSMWRSLILYLFVVPVFVISLLRTSCFSFSPFLFLSSQRSSKQLIDGFITRYGRKRRKERVENCSSCHLTLERIPAFGWSSRNHVLTHAVLPQGTPRSVWEAGSGCRGGKQREWGSLEGLPYTPVPQTYEQGHCVLEVVLCVPLLAL